MSSMTGFWRSSLVFSLLGVPGSIAFVKRVDENRYSFEILPFECLETVVNDLVLLQSTAFLDFNCLFDMDSGIGGLFRRIWCSKARNNHDFHTIWWCRISSIVNGRGDSYHEYLIKQFLQTSGQEPVYLEMWEEALEGIQKHLITTTKHSGLKFVAELPQGIGGPLSPKMDHLVCFLPGLIAMGATRGHTLSKARTWPSWDDKKEDQIQLARDLMKTCWGMYAVTKTGIAPEIAWFHDNEEDLYPASGDRLLASTKNSLASWKKDYIVKPLDAHNLQRPETVESLFMMWRVTEDPLYREWGWKIFNAFERHTKLSQEQGYDSVNDVNAIPLPQRDNMGSFWLAETLKYLYLLFSPNDFIPLTEVVFNTEAHIFPVINKVKWQTGWNKS